MADWLSQTVMSSDFLGAFRSEGYKANMAIPHKSGQDIPMEDLPALLRVLLVTDGTVTKSLESYFWEPVSVDVLGLSLKYVDDAIDILDIQAGEQVLERKVVLRGEQSHIHYAQANSIVRLNALHKDIREKLINGELGIGVLIRDSGMESYREIVDIHAQQRDYLISAEDQKTSREEVLVRSYRILAEAKPVILIQEVFPLAIYSAND